MKYLKCPSCDSESVRVEVRDKCKGCANNPCERKDVDGICELSGHACVKPGCESIEDSASVSGECDYGTTFNAGCWIVTCAKCGRHVEHWPTAYI